MNPIIGYIEERIRFLESDLWENSWIDGKEERIHELQAVLNKIKEYANN